MKIEIKASEGGFHFRGSTGELIAPEVFFADAFNPNGEIYQSPDGASWRTRESYVNGAIQIDVMLAREAALPPGARAGETAQLAISGFSFSRATSNGPELIGALELAATLNVDAEFQPNGSAAIGGGATPNWVADVGLALRDAFRNDGFTFQGSDGDDVFDPSSGALPLAADGELRGAAGNDVLTAQAGNGAVYGGSGNDALSALGGVHVFWGGAGDDMIDLGALRQGQEVYGGRGRDTIEGGRGDDDLNGGRGRDIIFGGEGEDILNGGGARDTLIGGEGADELYGGAGGDRLKGGFGADTLDGGAGNDKLAGGAGADSFIFSAGADVVMDFDPLADQIISDGASFEALQITNSDLGAVVSFDGGEGQVLLLGVYAEELSDANFLF
ncbi:MAG: calcium-binding protein [Pseudomonadota bacterium]